MLKEYEYTWTYLPTGRSGKNKIKLHNDVEMVKLINHWNHSPYWKYCCGSLVYQELDEARLNF